MASGNVTSTTAANWIPEVWSMETQDACEFAQVIHPRVNRDYEGEVREKGDIVNITTTSNYTANTKSASTDVTFENHTHGVQQLTINAHQYAAVKIEKFAEKQAMPGYREKQTKKLGYALARALDVALAALFDGFADNGTIGTLGVELTYSDYLAAWTKLADAGVIQEGMMDADVTTFLSPAAYAAALKLDVFISEDYGAENAVARASLGKILNTRVVMSNLLEADAANQHDCAMMHRDALTCAVQSKANVQSDYIIESIATAIVADQIYGVKELTWPQETAASVTMTDNRGVYLASV